MRCPNKETDEWKSLSEALGPDKAMLAYIRHGEEIPTIEQGKFHLDNFSDEFAHNLGLPKSDIDNLPEPTEEDKTLFDKMVSKAIGTTEEMRKSVSEIEKYTGDKKLINEFVAAEQASSGEKRKAFKYFIEQVPIIKRQNAIGVWIEANGDKALLAQQEAASKPKFKEKYQIAQNLTEKEIKAAQWVKQQFDTWGKNAQEKGIIKNKRDNYIPHFTIKDTKETVDALSGNPFSSSGKISKTFRSAKGRVFESAFDAEQKGYRLLSTNPAELLPAYIDGYLRSIMTNNLFRGLMESPSAENILSDVKKEGIEADVRPLAVPYGIMNQIKKAEKMDEGEKASPFIARPNVLGKEFSDYIPIEHPAARTMKWIGKTEDGTNILMESAIAVHPKIAKYINNMLKNSAIRDWYNDAEGNWKDLPKWVLKNIDEGQIAVKQGMFALSYFHLVQTGTHAVWHGINPFAVPTIDFNKNPEQYDSAKHGLMIIPEFGAQKRMSDELAVSDVLKNIPLIGRLIKTTSEPLFEIYIPGLKYKVYDTVLKRNQWLYKNEIASDPAFNDHVKYLTAHQVNSAFGHLNYADMGRNPTFQHIFRMLAVAPGFLEARAQVVGQAARSISGIALKSAQTVLGHNPDGKTHAQRLKNIAAEGRVGAESAFSLLTNFITMYYGCRIANYLLTGDDHKEQPFGVVYKQSIYSMRNIDGDLYDMQKNSHQFVLGRVSPIVGRGSMWLYSGKDYRGAPQAFPSLLKDLFWSGSPISMQGVLAKTLPEGITPNQRNKDISTFASFLGMMGLQSKRWSPAQHAFDLAEDWKKKNNIGDDQGIPYPPSKYRDVRNALEDNDIPRAGTEWEKLLHNNPKNDPTHYNKILTGFNASMQRPLTGSAVTERKFEASLSPNDRKAVEAAKKQRIDALNLFRKNILSRSTVSYGTGEEQ